MAVACQNWRVTVTSSGIIGIVVKNFHNLRIFNNNNKNNFNTLRNSCIYHLNFCNIVSSTYTGNRVQ